MFVRGQWPTVNSFLRDQDLKLNSRSFVNTKGWLEAKRQYVEEIETKAKERIIEDEVSIRQRQARLSRQLQLRGLKELEILPIKDADDARKMLVSGLEQEREALGVIKESDGLTQVNIKQLPRTRFDDVLEKMEYHELIELIAELKRLGAGKNQEQKVESG